MPRRSDQISSTRTAGLLLLLPLFSQTFHYMKDLPPLWALSKVFPILSLPLILPVIQRWRLAPWIWLFVFGWLVIVSSAAATMTFGQDFLIGLTAQVKLLPMLYALSFLGFLVMLRPRLREIEIAFWIWCAIAFAALVALWALAPQSWYSAKYELGQAPLLSVDHRGNRIRAPVFFLAIALFAACRFLLTKRQWSAVAIIAVALALVVGVVRTRAFVIATGVALAITAFAAASPRWRIIACGLAAVAAWQLIQIEYVASALNVTDDQTRVITAAKALKFLDNYPWAWVFGAGSLSSIDPEAMSRYFNHFFFLSDISWLGIVFEFGLVGAGLVLALLLDTWRRGFALRRKLDSPFLGALQDYVLFAIMVSPMYPSMTLQPGEIAIISAIFIYAGTTLKRWPAAPLRSLSPPPPPLVST